MTGVVSWGIATCGSPLGASVYASVPAMLAFVEEHVAPEPWGNAAGSGIPVVVIWDWAPHLQEWFSRSWRRERSRWRWMGVSALLGPAATLVLVLLPAVPEGGEETAR